MSTRRRRPELALIVTAALTTWAGAALPTASQVPGGVALLNVGPVDRESEPPQVRYHGDPVLVLPQADHWLAVVGIPLTATIGSDAVSVRRGAASAQDLPFNVSDKHYL